MSTTTLTKARVRFRMPKVDPLLLSFYARVPVAAAFFTLALRGREVVPAAPIVAILSCLVSIAAAVRAFRSAADTSPRRRVAGMAVFDTALLLFCAIPLPTSWSTLPGRISIGFLAIVTLACVAIEAHRLRR